MSNRGAVVVAAIISIVLVVTAAGQTNARTRPRLQSLYLHGYEPVGEAEFHFMPNSTEERVWKPMTSSEPSETLPRSMWVTNAGPIAPHSNCAGNPYYPVWKARLRGRVTALSIHLHTVAASATRLVVNLFPDLSKPDCVRDNDVDPTGTVVPYYNPTPPLSVQVVDIPAGYSRVTADFGDRLPISVRRHVVIQVQPFDQSNDPTVHVRLLYDSPEFPSQMKIDCTPSDCIPSS